MRRSQEEREADEAEADFVREIDEVQIARKGTAVFAPGLLSITVILAVASLSEERGVRMLGPPPREEDDEMADMGADAEQLKAEGGDDCFQGA